MTGRPVGRKTGLRRSGRRPPVPGRPPGTGRPGLGSRRPGSAGPPKSDFGRGQPVAAQRDRQGNLGSSGRRNPGYRHRRKQGRSRGTRPEARATA
eukprot:10348528-Heterocapsa_arctica.AAC.1